MTHPEVNRAEFTILVADDEPDNLDLLCRALHGYELIRATRADECLVKLGELPIDVVVADQKMPGGSGAEVLERARWLNPFTRRMIISAFADSDTLIQAINNGGVERYLVKPVTPGAVRRAVDELVAGLVEIRGQVERVLSLEDELKGLQRPERRAGERRDDDRRTGDRRWSAESEQMRQTTTESLQTLEHEIARSTRHGHAFALAILTKADALEAKLDAMLRKSDLVLDFGAELVCLLTETDALGAAHFCERIAEALPSVSVRTATYPDDAADAASLLAVAR